MKKHEVLNLDKVTKEVLFEELDKGMEDIKAGKVVSIKETKNLIKEKHAAYLQSCSIETRATRSS